MDGTLVHANAIFPTYGASISISEDKDNRSSDTGQAGRDHVGP